MKRILFKIAVLVSVFSINIDLSAMSVRRKLDRPVVKTDNPKGLAVTTFYLHQEDGIREEKEAAEAMVLVPAAQPFSLFSYFSASEDPREMVRKIERKIQSERKASKTGGSRVVLNQYYRLMQSCDCRVKFDALIARLQISNKLYNKIIDLRKALIVRDDLAQSVIAQQKEKLDSCEQYVVQCLQVCEVPADEFTVHLRDCSNVIMGKRFTKALEDADTVTTYIERALHEFPPFEIDVNDFKFTIAQSEKYQKLLRKRFDEKKAPCQKILNALAAMASKIPLDIEAHKDPGYSLKEKNKEIFSVSAMQSTPVELAQIYAGRKVSHLTALNLEDAQDSEVRCTRFIAAASMPE